MSVNFKDYLVERRRNISNRIKKGYRGKSQSLKGFNSSAGYDWDTSFIVFSDLDIKVPLTQKFLKTIDIKPVEREVFHVTFEQGADQLLKIAKDSKQRTPNQDKIGISAFTWAKKPNWESEDKWQRLPSILGGPIDTEDPSSFLFKLKARITGAWPDDVYSEPDWLKRRWVPLEGFFGQIKDYSVQFDKISNEIRKKRFEYAKRLIKTNTPSEQDLEEENITPGLLNFLSKYYKHGDLQDKNPYDSAIAPRSARRTLRSLWEEIPIIYSSNKKVVGSAVNANFKILADVIKTRTQNLTPQSSDSGYNEVVADEFEVLEAWVYLNSNSPEDGYDPYGEKATEEEQQEILKNKVDYLKNIGVKKVSILDPDNLPFPVI